MADSHELKIEPGTLSGFPGAAVLRLSGMCGPSVVRTLQTAIQPILAEGKTHLLFDCADVEYFNSTSLGYLINLAETVGGVGGSLSFCGMSKKAYASFDLLGLGKLFRIFDQQADWLSDAQISSAARDPSLQSSPVLGEGENSHLTGEAAVFALPAVLPAWLDEVDQAAVPPLDHLRWTAFLLGATGQMDVNPMALVAERLGIPPAGSVVQMVRLIVRKCQGPEDLLGLFDESVLAGMCRHYGLSAQGGKAALIASLVSFVGNSTTESLSSASATPAGNLHHDDAQTATQLAHHRLLQLLESCRPPKAIRSESAARTFVAKHLSKTLERKALRRNWEVGQYWRAKVDIEVSERHGILIRTAGQLTGKKKGGDSKRVFGLLGQVAVLSSIYGKGELFIVIVGEGKRDQGPALLDLKGRLESLGARVIQLRLS